MMGRYSLLQWVGLLALRACELGMAALIVAGVVGTALYRYYGQDLPDPSTLATHRPFETTRIYARDGETLLYELFDAGQRTVIPYADVPWSLKAATVAVEDADFFTNPGVDLRGIVRALYLNREGEVLSGGSTITQQLVRNVLLPEERTEQSYRRKIREAILALHLSRQFSKDQILAMYLNEIYYGNMAYGIEAAAQSYFGQSARTLTLPQAALLAGLPQSPTSLNPLLHPEAAKARQKIVLDLMVKQGYIDEQQATAAYAETLALRPAAVNIRYPHWVFYVRDLLEQKFGPELVHRGGLRVVTTLDPALQEMAMESAREQIAALAERNAHNAAVVVMDAASAEILAMVGSVDYNNAAIDGQVNVALAPRQPGSALKPLVYAAALDRGWTPSTIIWDTPTDFGSGYKPQNYDNTFHGPQRLRMALAGSLNIPAVKALQYVGLPAFLDLAHAMGITTLQE
ncbi:MAG TPA: transglycosylase domain-containing protein, partial [Herpetosiphonaceae bacterium]|nr:transglycosylase domain-containing protein [Herpetosiphonaceae bacterium]